jgi:peptidoglycan LD-endopeptidase CwlK
MRYLDACHFGTASREVFDTLSPNLQRLMKEAIRRAPSWLDFGLICGFRNQEDQDKAFAEGRSQKRWPDGNHNHWPSTAVDIRPASPFRQEDWKDSVRFARIVGFIECISVELDIPIRLGLDWDGDGQSNDQQFMDLGHIEEHRS